MKDNITSNKFIKKKKKCHPLSVPHGQTATPLAKAWFCFDKTSLWTGLHKNVIVSNKIEIFMFFFLSFPKPSFQKFF